MSEVCDALVEAPPEQPLLRDRLAKVLILLPRLLLRTEPGPPRSAATDRLNPGGRTARWLGGLAKSWADGEAIRRCVQDAATRTRPPRPAHDDEATRRKMDAVVRAVQKGNLSRAAQMLLSPGIAPGNDTTAAKVREVLERPNPAGWPAPADWLPPGAANVDA